MGISPPVSNDLTPRMGKHLLRHSPGVAGYNCSCNRYYLDALRGRVYIQAVQLAPNSKS